MNIVLDCTYFKKGISVKNILDCLRALGEDFRVVPVELCSRNELIKLAKEIINYNFNVIISGSDDNVKSDVGWIKDLKYMLKFLIENDAKIFGICFGGQLIFNYFYPDDMFIGDIKEEGIVNLSWNDRNISVFEKHKDLMLFDESHKKLKCLSVSEFNDKMIYQGFRVKGKSILGVQFHPEISPRNLKIFEEFFSLN